jgi:Alkylmercury lyase
MPEKVLERNWKSRRSMGLGASPDEWTMLATSLRLFIYRYVIAKGRAPSIIEMAKRFKSRKQVDAGLQRLCASHAFVLQENGELWRAAPFSAVPTAFPVKVGNRSYYGNCIWDALGIPAMLAQDAQIDASCGCCNFEMILNVKEGRLQGPKGLIHIAVPARDWYKDIVFT